MSGAPTPTPTPAAPAAPVASPCTGVCTMDPATGWCLGCARTLGEIAAWSTLDDAGKRAVWALLPARRARQPVPPDAVAVPPAPEAGR